MSEIVLLGLVIAGLLFLVVGVVVIAVILLGVKTQKRLGSDADSENEPQRRPHRRATPATTLQRCPECGANMDTDAVDGLCPQCLLKGAISRSQDAANSDPDAQTRAFVGPSAPLVEVLTPLFPQMEVLELIGQGGMGAVYKARQPSLDRLVAIKVLNVDGGTDPAFAERFNREARALARLSHPNIVAVHDVGKAGDFYYFVMEYVDGVNLRQLLRDGHLRPEQALRIVPQICDALQFAHEEGIVHRDIKPENILLDRKGRVKIADFGLAKLLGHDTQNFALTGSRQVMGTLYYMAPEQVERPLEVDHRADIYSLGVVFYEMLTGQLPVGHFPLPSEKSGTDPHLDGVVLHALEREPERRYQHASDVKTDVEARARTVPSLGRVTAAPRIELARHQLKAPAIGLMVAAIAGIVANVIAIVVVLEPHVAAQLAPSSVAPGFLAQLAVSLVGGLLVFAGAWKMKRLEAYEFSVITGVLALLPVTTFAWPISFVFGALSLWLLFKPEVRAAFREQLERSLHTQAQTAQRTPAAKDSAQAQGSSKAMNYAIAWFLFLLLAASVIGFWIIVFVMFA